MPKPAKVLLHGVEQFHNTIRLTCIVLLFGTAENPPKQPALPGGGTDAFPNNFLPHIPASSRAHRAGLVIHAFVIHAALRVRLREGLKNLRGTKASLERGALLSPSYLEIADEQNGCHHS